MRILALVLAVLLSACATGDGPRQDARSELAARVARASMRVPCVPGEQAAGPCLDDQGDVWSACSWNRCGVDEGCRRASQARVAAGSCGGDEWPPCR